MSQALSNFRERSDAEYVKITLSDDGQCRDATVTTDRRGFGPDAAIVASVR